MTPLRRRLLVYSAPVALAVIIAIARCVALVVAGNAAETAFTAGTVAVSENRLDDADREFSVSMARGKSADPCPARVNLELVRETQGDRAAATFDGLGALTRYLSARELVAQAPADCFAGNTDPDPDRRAIRSETAARLDSKITAARAVPPPPPPPPAVAAPPPPPQGAATVPADPDAPLRLNPGAGDPFDRLQEILRNAAP
ncbi:hypothetical protein M1247_01810 [Mycobacterium sp. 21AC1]|uniref:hypothetical protein n=1 Tax=[Mycobacterium] appelbergii TaxID=2939269 RepID=UPI002938FBD3|nr:hypothetical protein [Mycobacterium sp. 21AC1]MDV3123639.1 hypothetical protein [Mycobacterium sp. 21AC1]